MEGLLLISLHFLAGILAVDSTQVHPNISVTTSVSDPSYRSYVPEGDMFHFNCTVKIIDPDWCLVIVKTAFDVNPARTTYKLGSEWPQTIVKDGVLSNALSGVSRYSVHVTSVGNNMTITSVIIDGIKTEDGGTWDALVVNSCPNDTVTDMIHTNNSAAVNVNVVAPVTAVRIYATGESDLDGVILSDGSNVTLNSNMSLNLTCLVGIKGFSQPQVQYYILRDSDAGKTSNLTDMLALTEMPSNRSEDGGLVTFTDKLHYVYDGFHPNIMDHGAEVSCIARQQGYPAQKAYFVLLVESQPMVMFTQSNSKTKNEVVGRVGQSVQITATVLAHPPVTASQVTWSGPNNNRTGSSKIQTNNLNGKKTVSTLTISDVKKKDQGEYTCTATNKFGTTSAKIELVEKASTTSSADGRHATALFGLLLGLVSALIMH